MLESAGGTAHARAVLNAQFDAVEREMALDRTRVGKISAGLIRRSQKYREVG